MRVRQKEGCRGSLKWIQRAVAQRPELLQPEGLAPIRWLSPLAADGYAEYRDAAFLDQLGLGHLADRLSLFWPSRGPQWDALGLAGDVPVLVEAKAHTAEFFSPASQAQAASLEQISRAFAQVQDDLGLSAPSDWAKLFYQYANRIAHLWWLHEQHVDAHLVFVSFLGDDAPGIRGPKSAETWRALFAAADYTLGLPARYRLSRYIHHVTPEVSALSAGIRSTEEHSGPPTPTRKQAMKHKYDPLRDYLIERGASTTTIDLSFAQIESIIGADLPPSAFEYREWWANQTDVSKRSQARAWIEAGFTVENVQQQPKAGAVRFVKS